MKVSKQKTACPYCGKDTTIQLPDNYAPVYMHCRICTRKLIVEQMSDVFQAIPLETSPAVVIRTAGNWRWPAAVNNNL